MRDVFISHSSLDRKNLELAIRLKRGLIVFFLNFIIIQ